MARRERKKVKLEIEALTRMPLLDVDNSVTIQKEGFITHVHEETPRYSSTRVDDKGLFGFVWPKTGEWS